MTSIFDGYRKEKEYLVCIDSDGCVMDTMNRKHIMCFGPAVIKQWHLEERQDEILRIWNSQNLFTKTRGINRFKGLSLLFDTIVTLGIDIPGKEELKEWCSRATSLSNEALVLELQTNPSACLRNALYWSEKVNDDIAALSKEDCIFPNAKEAMQFLHEYADLVIISSANKEAVLEEWTRLCCIDIVHLLCGQEAGTKSFCIHELKQYYEDDHVLMIGDALSDLLAAQENDVMFYPILVTKEAMSWENLKNDAGFRFLHSAFTKEYEAEWIQKMKKILS